ncbi:MAG TPA: circadian clock protein KaiC, partial [Gemmatimonadaceae bacterium]|nr:circadian clock protein KaiC [Gemmatimonadaceae bacterium]
MGGPGCGKTVFALQALVNGARLRKEAGIFVAFEESTVQIIANGSTFAWDLPIVQGKKLHFVDARLSPTVVQGGEFDLVGMLSALGAKARQMKATCIVFDGIDVLLGLLDDPVAERRELYRLRDWLVDERFTGIITQKTSGHEGAHHYDFLQFMVDCVVVLRHQVTNGSAFRDLRVMKFRGSAFAADEFPITLTREGMQLTHRGPTELSYAISNKRVSSGIPRLDHMLCGGYYRGSTVLVSGAPGTAKSTLAGLFAAAACQRGERVLYVSFDEGAAQIVRNLRSVNVHLAPFLKSGLLKMYSTRTSGPNVEDQFADLRAKVNEYKPHSLVIDPVSALSTKIAHLASVDATQQFLHFIKIQGITALNTSLLAGINTDESTATNISTIADTWIHLSYIVHDGERNRALTIVKSRGTGHSNQVRELTLTDAGVSLTDVFVAHGKVLMGVARWEWEQEQEVRRLQTNSDAEFKRLQLHLAQAEAAARLQVIQTEMEARTAQMALLSAATGRAATVRKTDRATLRKLRHADKDWPPLRPGTKTVRHAAAKDR